MRVFYAESVREMFESGNFLDIQYNYEARYNKPPLTYWLIAASASVFGLNEFGIRPSNDSAYHWLSLVNLSFG